MEVIFSEGPFTLVKKQGVGMNNTPWEGLEVKSSDAADKHVVEIRLEPNWPKFEGQPVKYSYNPDIELVNYYNFTYDLYYGDILNLTIYNFNSVRILSIAK